MCVRVCVCGECASVRVAASVCVRVCVRLRVLAVAFVVLLWLS